MIQIVLYQNTNQRIAEAYGKWFPRVANTETVALEELAEHMAAHNTPFSKGAILGMLTDFVGCTKELLLLGKNVKIPDLAIFSLGLKVKSGAASKEEFSVAKNIAGLKLRARATGELTTANLDTTIKRIDLATSSTSSDTSTDDSGGSTPGGSTSGGSTSGGSTDTSSGGQTSSGSTSGDSGTGED